MGKARHTTLRLNHEQLRNNYAITGWLVLVRGRDCRAKTYLARLRGGSGKNMLVRN
jgi:hypothetical protein